MTTAMTHRHARAEVVGYSEPVLEAVRELIHQVDATPELGLISGQMMAGIGAGLALEDIRASTFLSAIAHLVTVAAEVALEKEAANV